MLHTTQLEKPDNGKFVRHYFIFWQSQDKKEFNIRILKTIISKKHYIIENIYKNIHY